MMKRALNAVESYFKIALIVGAVVLLQACASSSGIQNNFANSASTGKRVALVIGNNSYINVHGLDNPINDATDISEALKSLGFQVILKTDSRKSATEIALKEFEQLSRNANVALIYFSGHGMQVNGENILIPIDYNFSDPSTGVSANAIQKLMQNATKGTKLMILDACRNNPFNEYAAEEVVPEGKKRGTKKTGTRKFTGLAPMIALKEFIVMYSTAAGYEAADGRGRNSPYTSALLEHIKEPVPIETLFKRVSATVAQNTNPPQLPANYTAGLTGDFCFTGCGVEIADVSQTCHLTIGKGIYEGECQDGKANGQGVQRYADGEYYTGSFKDNLRQGYGSQYLTDGTEISGYWEKGRMTKNK